jgi:hypothetical protein
LRNHPHIFASLPLAPFIYSLISKGYLIPSRERLPSA